MRIKTALNFLGLEPGVSQSQIQESFESLYFEYCDPSRPESEAMTFLFSRISASLANYNGSEVYGFKANKDTLEAMKEVLVWLIQNEKIFFFKGSWIHVEDSQFSVSEWDEARKQGFMPSTKNRSTWAFHVKGDESRGRGGFSSAEIDSKYGSHVIQHSLGQLQNRLKQQQQKQQEDEDNEQNMDSQVDKENGQEPEAM